MPIGPIDALLGAAEESDRREREGEAPLLTPEEQAHRRGLPAMQVATLFKRSEQTFVDVRGLRRMIPAGVGLWLYVIGEDTEAKEVKCFSMLRDALGGEQGGEEILHAVMEVLAMLSTEECEKVTSADGALYALLSVLREDFPVIVGLALGDLRAGRGTGLRRTLSLLNVIQNCVGPGVLGAVEDTAQLIQREVNVLHLIRCFALSVTAVRDSPTSVSGLAEGGREPGVANRSKIHCPVLAEEFV